MSMLLSRESYTLLSSAGLTDVGADGNPGTLDGSQPGGWTAPWDTMQMMADWERGRLVPQDSI